MNVHVPPRTPLEQCVALIWTEVLKLDNLGIDDNFFAVGGHSLKATQIISRVRDTFRVDLPLRALFEAPTVADFTIKLKAKLAESGALEQVERFVAETPRAQKTRPING